MFENKNTTQDQETKVVGGEKQESINFISKQYVDWKGKLYVLVYLCILCVQYVVLLSSSSNC